MNANGYLTRIAIQAHVRELEDINIRRSLESLQGKIALHFQGTILTGKPVRKHFAFGSFTRGTMLPRSMDPQSDIDYMVVFSDSEAKPQAYLDRLRRFVEARYPRSEIAQSTPTIVLSLNHIRFELVPAIEGIWGGLRIPTRSSGYQTWQDTEPNTFNESLTEKNKSNGNQIKPLIRVLKYWNARNGYPFESYQLERQIVNHVPLIVTLLGGNLWDRFTSFVEDMGTSWGDPAYKGNAISRAKELVAEINAHERRQEEQQAQRKLERLLPPID
jgi:predicted nucleotidyltransferase